MSDPTRILYRELTEDEKKHIETFKRTGDALMQLLDVAGNSREASIAKTKVEEAVMWGVKHFTR
jgi:hypothetical protein